MAIPWLLIAVVGLVAKVVSCQGQSDLGDPPPLPAQGVLLCTSNAQCKLRNFRNIEIS